MEKYVWLDVNMSSYELVDSSSSMLKKMRKEWMLDEFKGGKSPLENEKTFRTVSAVIHDSIILIGCAIMRSLNEILSMKPVYCEIDSVWSQGSSLLKHFKQVTYKKK
jgi:hypothetical protein